MRAKLLLTSKMDRRYRTVLTNAQHHPVNFAGRYILARIGCGSTCEEMVAIDTATGRVAWIPDSICCWAGEVNEPIDYRANSRLLILTGACAERVDGVWYWLITKRGFELIHQTKPRFPSTGMPPD